MTNPRITHASDCRMCGYYRVISGMCDCVCVCVCVSVTNWRSIETAVRRELVSGIPQLTYIHSLRCVTRTCGCRQN